MNKQYVQKRNLKEYKVLELTGNKFNENKFSKHKGLFTIKKVLGNELKINRLLNHDFCICQNNFKLYDIYHVKSGKMLIEKIKLKNLNEEIFKLIDSGGFKNFVIQLNNLDTLKSIIINSNQRVKLMKRLSKLLKFIVPYDYFLYLFTGKYTIDIIKLDEILETPDNISLRNHITNLYGEEASNLIDQILNL